MILGKLTLLVNELHTLLTIDAKPELTLTVQSDKELLKLILDIQKDMRPDMLRYLDASELVERIKIYGLPINFRVRDK